MRRDSISREWPTATEGDIHVNAARLDVESVNALAESTGTWYVVAVVGLSVLSLYIIYAYLGVKVHKNVAYEVTKTYQI